MDRIRIEALEVDCIVGLRSFERRRRQTVRVDIELGMDLSRAGKSGRITATVDYSRVADEVTHLLRFREYRLIEVATEELAAMLFGVHPMLAEVGIRVEKPEALRGRARAASVQIHRNRGQFPSVVEATDYGSLETLFVTPEARLLLYMVNPGGALSVANEPDLRHIAWPLSEALSPYSPVEGEGRPGVQAALEANSYRNLGQEPAGLFYCESRAC